MSSHFEINQRDYKVSTIRIVNLIVYGLVGATNIRVSMCDNTEYNFTTNLSDNMLREILITLDSVHTGIRYISIKNKDAIIRIFCEHGKIITDINKERVKAVADRLELLKTSGELQQTFVEVLHYKSLTIADVFDLLSEYGQLANANTIILDNCGKMHIAKYRYFSVVVYNNKVYIIDFGVNDHVKARKVTDKIRIDFDRRVQQKSKLEEFCIR